MLYYRHTQFGWVIFILLLSNIALMLAISLYQGWHPAVIFVAIVLTFALLLFFTLTVEVKEEVLEFRFGIGLIHKRFLLQDIRDIQTVKNRWYYGWGIRFTPHGWLYNVSGLDAVEITLASGKKFRIGTDEPEALLNAVQRKINRE